MVYFVILALGVAFGAKYWHSGDWSAVGSIAGLTILWLFILFMSSGSEKDDDDDDH